jgi:hypothetical protein
VDVGVEAWLGWHYLLVPYFLISAFFLAGDSAFSCFF